jgi:hypothetical protein
MRAATARRRLSAIYLERELRFHQGFDFCDSPFRFEAFSHRTAARTASGFPLPLIATASSSRGPRWTSASPALSSEGQMAQAQEAFKLGPMDEDELAWMRRVGRAVSAK